MKNKKILFIFIILFILGVIYLFYNNSSKENFVFNKNRKDNSTNKCSNRTTSSECKGYGSDGYCEWCGSSGCHSSDEIAKKHIQGCKG